MMRWNNRFLLNGQYALNRGLVGQSLFDRQKIELDKDILDLGRLVFSVSFS